jgi:glycyl-tRNA synthetase beta chain
LVELSKLQKPVDDFFEAVMVMDKDEAIKNNRLHILQALQVVFSCVANVSLL